LFIALILVEVELECQPLSQFSFRPSPGTVLFAGGEDGYPGSSIIKDCRLENVLIPCMSDITITTW